MDEAAYYNKLKDLIKEIVGLPKDEQKRLAPLINETLKRHDDIKKDSDKVSACLADLKLLLKYVVFDLEATRRERDSLIELINNSTKDDD